MKKKTAANLIMAALAAAILIGGIAIAMYFMGSSDVELGTEYKLADSPKLELLGEDAENICTITIQCDTILDHLDAIDEAKLPYVPKDGIILPTTEVEFSEGETAFDIMKRVCEAYDLQMEYSWTPAYDSYYIEGLNHIYEFDCGPESGWMYKVNDWFPNYGCSEYQLSNGDVIVWTYTSVGYGSDVGDTGSNEG